MGAWFVALFSAVIAALIQRALYLRTRKKFVMIFIPAVSAILSAFAFIIVIYGNYSIFDTEAMYFFAAILIGAPIVVGSSVTGVILAIKHR